MILLTVITLFPFKFKTWLAKVINNFSSIQATKNIIKTKN